MWYKLGVVVLIATLVSCTENHQGIRVEDSQLVDLIESFPKVDTFGVNQFWNELDVQSITLYTYFPEAHIEEILNSKKDVVKGESNHILNDEMKLNRYVLEDYTIELDSIDFERLKRGVLIETSLSEVSSSCFEPHHGFVLKDGMGKIVGHISVCLECSNYRIYPKHNGQISMSLFRDIIVKNKLPIHRSQVGRAYREGKGGVKAN